MDFLLQVFSPSHNTFGDYGAYAELLLSVLGLFAALATVIPAPRRNSRRSYKAFYIVMSWLACNFGRAKNAPRHEGGPR